MRSIDISHSADHLVRIESGMRELSEAVRDLIERGRMHGSRAIPGARRPDGRIRIAPVKLSYESSWLPA